MAVLGWGAAASRPVPRQLNDPGPNFRRLAYLSRHSDVHVTFGQESDGQWEARADSLLSFGTLAHVEVDPDIEVAAAALIAWLVEHGVTVPEPPADFLRDRLPLRD